MVIYYIMLKFLFILLPLYIGMCHLYELINDTERENPNRLLINNTEGIEYWIKVDRSY